MPFRLLLEQYLRIENKERVAEILEENKKLQSHVVALPQTKNYKRLRKEE